MSTVYKAGFIGLIGQPNAGKSTLMNYLVEEKVSIVSAKPQTTRRRIMGLWNSDQGQIIFVDAPGIVDADKGLNGFLAVEAQDVISQSDALLAVLSVDERSSDDAVKVIDMVSASRKPWIAIITKTDLSEKEHRVMILRDLIVKKGGKVLTIGNLQNLKKEGRKNNLEVQELRKVMLAEFLQVLPETPAPLYDVELFTTESVRNIVCEIIREKCFEMLHMELPYSTAVRIVKFDEEADPCPKIYAEILVAKDNHKAIVIGKGGQTLKQIGMESRLEVEKMMDKKVYLDLTVTFKKDWYLNKNLLKDLGYVVEKKR